MSAAYRNAIRDHGASIITHIGLVDAGGADLAGGSYARKPVTWATTDPDGLMRPSADLVFDVPAGATVAGWRGYSALSAGSNYGGADLTQETYGSAGTYTLLAASTSVDHNAA
jgi:hypothetical protein